MADLEKKLCELLHELPQKRSDYEKLQQQYNSELLRHRELKTEMDNLRTEADNLRTQLEFTNKALRKSEESYSAARDYTVKHRLSLEASTKTMDFMKDESTKLHMENAHLKRRIEELERDIKVESFSRESCSSKEVKTQAAIESLTTQIRNLEKDSRDTERHVKESLSTGAKSKLMLAHKDSTIAQLQDKCEKLSLKLVSVTSENRNLQEKVKEKKPVEQHYMKEILQEWQTSVSQMRVRSSNYEKELEIRQQVLQNTLNAQAKYKKLEAAANDRVRELQIKLGEAKKEEKKNRTDCGVQTDLNISIDVACETSQVEEKDAATLTADLQAHSPSLRELLANLRQEKNSELQSSGPCPPALGLSEMNTQVNLNINID